MASNDLSKDDIVTRCLRRHSQNIATISGLYAFIGVFFMALVIAIPAKPGEEGPKAGIAGFALLCLTVAIVDRIRTTKRRDRMAALMGPQRAELARAQLVEIRKGHARMYAVDLVDRAGVSLRLGAPNAQAAQELVAHLQK